MTKKDSSCNNKAFWKPFFKERDRTKGPNGQKALEGMAKNLLEFSPNKKGAQETDADGEALPPQEWGLLEEGVKDLKNSYLKMHMHSLNGCIFYSVIAFIHSMSAFIHSMSSFIHSM